MLEPFSYFLYQISHQYSQSLILSVNCSIFQCNVMYHGWLMTMGSSGPAMSRRVLCSVIRPWTRASSNLSRPGYVLQLKTSTGAGRATKFSLPINTRLGLSPVRSFHDDGKNEDSDHNVKAYSFQLMNPFTWLRIKFNTGYIQSKLDKDFTLENFMFGAAQVSL